MKELAHINQTRGLFLILIIINHIYLWSDNQTPMIVLQDYGAIGFLLVSGFLWGNKQAWEKPFPTPRIILLLILGATLELLVQGAVAVILVNFAIIFSFTWWATQHTRKTINPAWFYKRASALLVLGPLLSLTLNSQIPFFASLPFTGGTHPAISWASIYFLGAGLGLNYLKSNTIPSRHFHIALALFFIFKTAQSYLGWGYQMAQKPLSTWEEFFSPWAYQSSPVSLIGGTAGAYLLLHLLTTHKTFPPLTLLGKNTLTLYTLHLLTTPLLKEHPEPPLASLLATTLGLLLFNYTWFRIFKNKTGLIEGLWAKIWPTPEKDPGQATKQTSISDAKATASPTGHDTSKQEAHPQEHHPNELPKKSQQK